MYTWLVTIMKIVLAHHYSLTYVGGGEKFLIELARFLVSRGHMVEVRALPTNRRSASGSLLLPKEVVHIEKWSHSFGADVAYFIYAPLVHRLFRTDAPKVAGIHGAPLVPELQAREVFQKSPFKLIKSTDLYFASSYWFTKIGLRDIDLRVFNAVHVINPAVRINHPRIFFIPLYVDTARYRPVAPKTEKFTVLFVGRPLWRKGIDMFIETARIVKRILGDRVEFMSTNLPPEDVEDAGPVKYLGFIREEEQVQLYSSSCLVLYPSRIDTFGKVIIEALACGTPVVTTPIGSHLHLNLPLLYASNTREFVKKVVEVYNMWRRENSEYNELCKRGREAVESMYSATKVLPNYEEMLVRVAREFKRA